MTTTALGFGTAPLGTAPVGDGDVPETVGMTDKVTFRVHHRHVRVTWGAPVRTSQLTVGVAE